VLCEYFHTTLVEDPTVREHIHTLYKERPEVLNRLTATQWLVPASATILPNRVGSAPIMVLPLSDTRYPISDIRYPISDNPISENKKTI
jgi:molybdopterin-biosynthesis enzyme MoeA-like protein